MKIENHGERLSVSQIPELTSVNCADFRDDITALLADAPPIIEIDLSDTSFVDSSGLGALFSIRRATAQRNGIVLRLLKPRAEIQQLLELTQMQQLFEIVPG